LYFFKFDDYFPISDSREAEDEIRRLTELAEQLNPKLNGGMGGSGGDNLSTSDQVKFQWKRLNRGSLRKLP
jgi:hypothetical protein